MSRGQEPQKRRLPEWEDKRARRQAEFTALIPAIAAQVAAEVSAAVSAALQAARFADLQAKLAADHAAAAQPSSVAGVVCGTDLEVALPTICSSAYPGSDTATAMAKSNPASAADDSSPISALVAVLPAGVVRGGDLDLAAPTTRSTDCSGRATASAASATPTSYKAMEVVVPEPAAVTTTSSADTSILPVCVARHGDCDLVLPTPCLSLCPGGDTSALAASMIAPMVLGETAVTTACKALDNCVYLVPHLVSSASLESDLIVALPTTSYVVCLDPVSDAPAAAVTQDALDVDSSGSDPLASMSAPHDKPEGTDIAVMLEDKQLLFPSKDVAGDYVPLKLELPLLETKEQNLSPPLPHLASATISCYTHMHHLQAKFSYSSGSCNSHQRTGYISNQKYLPWLIQSSCSSENASSKCFCQDKCVQLRLYQFNSVGWEGELRPLPWPSFMCRRPSGLPRNQVLRMLSASTASAGWSVAIKRRPWPPPLSIHGFVPPREKNEWIQSWLELLLFANDCSLEAWLCCHTTGSCGINKHMGLTVGNDTVCGADSLEFMSYVPVHCCKLIDKFMHEKLWDPGGIHSCAWKFPWLFVLVNCKSFQQCSLLQGMHAMHSVREPYVSVNCYHLSFDLHRTSSREELHLQVPSAAPTEQPSTFQAGGIIAQVATGDVHMTDTCADEADRGIAIKSTSFSLSFAMTNAPLASYKAALHITNGAFVVVHTIECVCVENETVLRQALGERIRLVLRVNKMGICFLELQVEGEEAYQTFSHVIGSATVIMATYEDVRLGVIQVYLKKGVVDLSAGLHGWFFTLTYFTQMYASKFGVDESKMMKRFGVENFLDPATKKWKTKNTGSATCNRNKLSPSFCAYLQWQIALSSKSMKLAGASSLQAVVLYWSTNHPLQCGLELLQWLIAWPLATRNGYAIMMVSYSSSEVWVVSTGICTCMRKESNRREFGWRARCLLLEIFVWAMSNQDNLVGKLRLIYKLMAKISDVVDPLPRSAYLQLSWDPGGLNFFRFFTRAEAQGRRNATGPAYYRSLCLDHAYYFNKVCANRNYDLNVFLNQVCFDYGACCDLIEVKTQQVPWDPGGSAWHRLEVKPKFKEGGMLATSPTVTTGPGLGCHYWAWPAGKTPRQRLHIPTEAIRTGGLELDGFGLHSLGTPSSASVSSSSLVPLFPCNS